MNQIVLSVALMILISVRVLAQVSVTNDGNPPDPSAMLEVKSSVSGLLIPRMTASQIIEIPAPANGLMVFNTSNDKLYIYVASQQVWKEVNFGTGTLAPFVCGGLFVDGRDNKTYSTVLIGTQCWMGQNLDYGTMIPATQWQSDNTVVEKFCYSDSPDSCSVYGGLYQWGEMVQYFNGASNNTTWSPAPTGPLQGICPVGWHLPTDPEWTQLMNFFGNSGDAGGPLKEAGYAHWNFPNAGATNSSNFTALPGGIHYSDGNYYLIRTHGWFWTATDEYPAVAWYYNLQHANSNLERNTFDKQEGFSVRCIKD